MEKSQKILEQQILLIDVPKPKVEKSKHFFKLAKESKSENPKKEKNKTEKQNKQNIESDKEKVYLDSPENKDLEAISKNP
jgi:hypothetical protein